MTFPVHRSAESSPRERGEAFGRALAPQVRNTVATYRRMFTETHAPVPDRIEIAADHREEIAGIARAAGVDEQDLVAVNARTEILAGADECSVIGAGGLLAQNWDWHPDLAASTVIWIVEHDEGRWFATLTEAGILAKIGLNQAGLGLCLNILRTTADGGVTGTPIHLLLREVLSTCTTVDEAVAHLTRATVSASSAVTVATPGDVAHVELNPGGANVLRGAIGAHTNHFLQPPKAGTDMMTTDSPTTHQRLEVTKSGEPLLDILRSHDSHPQGVCRHVDPGEPWAEQSVTIASVVMNLEKLRLHVAAGPPCTHEHVQITLPQSAPLASTAAR
jgi:isopenicillin-N N-acyltransferase-like protein